MTDRQTRLRRIAVANILSKRFADVEKTEKAALSKEMTRGSEAVVDDNNREIGLVSVPKVSAETVTYELDEAVVIPWLFEENPEVVEEIVRLKDWARKEVIERAKKAHAAGEELPVGVVRMVSPGRTPSPRFIETKADSEMGVRSGSELVDDMIRRRVLTLDEVLAIGGAK